MELILIVILALICGGLLLMYLHSRSQRAKDAEYLHEAIFRSWIRETETQCRKSAYVHKKIPPVVESREINRIKQISISKPATDTQDKVLLAAININFKRFSREVNMSCSEVVKVDPSERWPINGGEWSPITLIKNELWKYFDDDPNSESTYDFKPLPTRFESKAATQM